MKTIPPGPGQTTTPAIRLAPAPDRTPLAFDVALTIFRGEFSDAKTALAKLLSTVGHFNLRKMFDGSALTVRDLRVMREVAVELTGHANAILAALDACIDATERADRSEGER